MDLPQTINTNQTAIARIVAGLFALLGLTGGSVPARIPGALHRSILRVLRPAESAVRRLIVIVSKTIRLKASAARPMPSGIVRTGQGTLRRSFQLFDPRPRLLPQQPAPKAGHRPQPRITFFGNGEVRTITLASEPPARNGKADGQQNSATLVRRLEALKAALDDLPRQARRLARALARRQTSPRLVLKGVMRPGRAPGWRKRPVEDIDRVLHQCDWLARDILPNTS